MNLEKELADYLTKIKKREISLQEASKLYFEAKEKFFAAEKKEQTKKSIKLALEIFFRASEISGNFVEEWQSGKIVPKDEDLNLLEKGCKEVLEVANFFEKNLPNNKLNKLIDWEQVKKIQILIKQEKSRRQNNSRSENNNSTSPPSSNSSAPVNNSQITQLQNQLNQLQQQIQSLLANQNKNLTNNNQFQQIQEQLNALQNQIQSLEKQPNSPNAPVSQSDKQELIKLKNQTQQLQKDLQSKQTGEQKGANNSQQPENKFNWLYVVIPGTVLLVVMGIIIAYLVGKKSKKE
ncbi:MAG: hypothetical protein MRECE_7c047 [Mycoplasmataceae bacterium CE_OT135]|nr:MAG: hypothetical protein MRECE_7c047 [Mycoplasmataceae bacterium CE_OT135]